MTDPAAAPVPAAPPVPGPVLGVLGRGVVPADTPVARADDAGLTRGDGCFEGLRLQVHADGSRSVDKLDRHLARFTRSAAALDIPFDRDAWARLVQQVADAWPQPGEAALKLVLTRGRGDGPTGYAWLVPVDERSLRQRRDGITVLTLARGLSGDAFAGAPWLLGGVKTLSYAVNMAAQRWAAAHGADDVLFVAADGAVLEAPTASVVWSVGRTLRTIPTGPTGILPGTTQDLLFERAADAGWTCETVPATVADLHDADAVWLASSVRGPAEVVVLDGRPRTRRPDVDAEVRQLAGF